MATDADLNGPAAIVDDMYQRSVVLADEARADQEEFLEALREAIPTAPQFSVQLQELPAPTLAAIPNMPSMPALVFQTPPGAPGSFDVVMDDVVIDDFNVVPPTLTARSAPDIVFAPVPTIPDPRDVTVPNAPVITLPAVPQMLTLTQHTFGGLDLHEEWLDKLEDIPALSLLAPQKLQYTPGQKYTSQLLTNLQATINARLNGYSGTTPAVEQQVWDRGRDRETQSALAREADANRLAEGLGFPLPSGVLVGMRADSRRQYRDELATLARDVTVKKVELQQANVKEAIQAALALEGQLIDYSFKIESLVFEAAKALADNEIAAYNAATEHYKALLAGYDSYARAYDTLIKAELSKVEVYKALIDAEKSKADMNIALVQQYKAEIEGVMANVEIFKAQVQAAETLVELERTRIQTAGEQIRAIVASNNAEMSKVELYKAQISGDQLLLESFTRQTQAYAAKAGAQAEKARTAVAKFQVQSQAYGVRWDAWRTQVAAESARVEAIGRQSGVMVDGYKVAVTASQGQAELYARMWEASFKQYETVKTLTFQAAKANGDALMAVRAQQLDAAKVGAQVSSQTLASAFNAVNTSATISGSATLTQVINS